MSDLVKKLREYGHSLRAGMGFKHMPELFNSAADEIERLEKEVGRLSVSGIHTCSDTCERPMCILWRKNKRLQDVLVSVLEIAERNEAGNVTKRARKALEESK